MSLSRRILLLPAVLLIGACSSLTEEEQSRLTNFQQNAATYWGAKRYEQALDMVNKGREIEPDDYKLNGIGGYVYLMWSEAKPENLLIADEYFERIHYQRSMDDHTPYFVLGYSRTKQLIATQYHRRALSLMHESQDPNLGETEQTIRATRSAEHQQRAKVHRELAKRGYQVLLDREELLRQVHKSLMEMAVEERNYDEGVKQGDLALRHIATDKEYQQARVTQTMVFSDELDARGKLTELREQETRIRTSLAEMHFQKGKYSEAVTQLDVLLQLDPTRSTDYYNRALALERLGQIGDARRDYEKFLGTTSLPDGDERVAHAFSFTRSD